MMCEKGHTLRLWIFGLLTLSIMTVIFLFSAQNADNSREMSDGFLASLIGSVLERILPPLSQQGMDADIRKYAHMAEYFSLGVSTFLFFSEHGFWRSRCRAGLYSLFVCFVYACSDEIHQLFVPGRAGMFRDVLVDGAGFSAGILISVLLTSVVVFICAFKAK